MSEKDNKPMLDGAEEQVRSMMDKWPNESGLFNQLQNLSHFIGQTRDEIAALRPDEVKAEFLPKATDELDAIVEATADATNQIMDSVEKIETLSEKMDHDDAASLLDSVTSIYEACTFQDITGQRITKVVNMLKEIEARVDQMIGSMDLPEGAKRDGPKKAVVDNRPDAELMQGPADAGTKGQSQEEIDALLASFD